MIRPVLFICIFVLFFAIYYYNIEEYARGVTEPATPSPYTSPPLVFSPCRGVYNWTATNSRGTVYPITESEAVCTSVPCSSTITGIFQNKETDPNLMCSIPSNKTIVCPRCQDLLVSSCQFTPNNTADSQILVNDIQAQPILTITDPAYAVDTGTVSAYQTTYNKYMDLIKTCNSPPPFDTASNCFICPSTSPVATVTQDRVVVCSS